MFLLGSCNELVKSIQKEIKGALSTIHQNLDPHSAISDSQNDDSSSEMLQSEQNFDSLFSTIVWFIEQDPYTNIAMNLDVNCRKVDIGNFQTVTDGRKMIDEIWKETGKTFQNS